MNRDPANEECKVETPRDYLNKQGTKDENENNSTNPNTYSNIITPQSMTI